MAWLAPDVWFQAFHGVTAKGLETAFLRRSGGQWAAFSLAQAITLWRWRKNPVWLAVEAGVRFSDLFTDISYVVTVPSLTILGWVFLLPPPVLKFIGVVIILRGYEQTQRGAGGASG